MGADARVSDIGTSDSRQTARAKASQRDITALLTCYNEAGYIAAAIESVRQQTSFDRIARILVIDDGSTDNSAQVLRSLQKSVPRLEVRTIANGGISAARNAGLSEIDTEWVALLDGDDFWAPDRIERQLAAIKEHDQRVALLYGDFIHLTTSLKTGSLIRVRRFSKDEDPLRRYFVFDGPILPSTTLLRVGAAKAVGLFNPQFRLFEECDFVLRLASAGYRFQHVAGALAYKRQRAGSLSSNPGEWESAAAAVSDAAIARSPTLAKDANRRMGYRLAKVAENYLSQGRDADGRRYLVRSVRLFPFNPRALAYLVMAALPLRLRLIAKATLQRMRVSALARVNR